MFYAHVYLYPDVYQGNAYGVPEFTRNNVDKMHRNRS